MFEMIKPFFALLILSLTTSCSKQIASGGNDYYSSDGTTTFSAHSDDPDASVLFFATNCFIIGKSSQPYAAIISPDFNPETISGNTLVSLYKVKILSVEYDSHSEEGSSKFDIPQWINNFDDLQVLSLEGIEIGDICNSKPLRIRHLIVGHLTSNRQLNVSKLVDIAELKYLAYSDPELIEDLSALRSNAPHISILSQRKYNRLVDRGRITVINYP
jgi:hypothetical protein